MLQSPKFLYRSELGPAGAPLDGYEIASKLSFWLLGTTPSDELLDAAAAGALDSVDGLESAARAMLEQPAAVEVMRDFHGQLYRLALYDDVDRADVPAVAEAELAETSHRFFDAVFTGGEGLRAILTSTRVFVGPGLAASYGVAAGARADRGAALDPSRIGYFMQVPFLLLNGRDDGPDPIRRGAALADEVLCLALLGHARPRPPLPPLAAGQTNRDRVEQRPRAARVATRDLDQSARLRVRGLRRPRPARATRQRRRRRHDRELFVRRRHAAVRRRARADAHPGGRHAGAHLLREDADGLRAAARPRRGRSAAAAGSRGGQPGALLEGDGVSLVRNPAFRLRAEGTP